MDYKNGGLKNVDIRIKIGSLQYSWIKRPYDSNFHVCFHISVIPKYLISKTFGSMFKFHPNLDFKKDLLKQFPVFYRSIFNNWKTQFSTPEISSCILSEFFWPNRHIKIDNEPVFFKHFSEQGISFIYQLFHKNGIAKKWEILQTEYKLDNSFISNGVSLYTLCLNSGKQSINLSKNSDNLLLYTDHHINRKSRIITGGKLTVKEILLNLIFYDKLQTNFSNVF